MDTTREQEERYLGMLRRFALFLAKTLLVFATLALLAAAYQGAKGAYHWWDGNRSHLPSQAERLEKVDPCPYFTNTARESNGRDDDGAIPVKTILISCKVAKTPDARFDNPSAAIDASVDDYVAIMLEGFGKTFNNEPQARGRVRKYLNEAAERAARPIRNSVLYSDKQKESLALEVATAIAAYFAMVRDVLKPENITSPDTDYAFDARFVVNQIQVDLQIAVQEKTEALSKMALAFATAFSVLKLAAQLLAAFLALMFLFLFIKYELHLRDMNNSLNARVN